MKSRTFWPVMALLLFYVTVASAQRPILDMVATKAVQKYQTGACERGGKRNHKKVHSQQEQQLIELLDNDAQMRIEFINSRGPCHQQDVRMRVDSVRITDKCGNRGQSSPPYKRSLLSCRAESMRRVPGREPECPRATSGNWVATLLIVA